MKKNQHPAKGKIVYIDTEDLSFDPDNPRFYRLNDASSIPAVIDEMLDDEGVQDLMLSIGEKDYFEGEPLLVATHSDGSLIVVEGNRRLAATKLLNGEITPPKRRIKSVESVRLEATYKPTSLPCIQYGNRKDVLRYLGYRHITGVKQWDSLSKAKYLAQLRDEFYPNEELKRQLKVLANDIGSKPAYVGRLLTALELYTRAENKKFFKLGIRNEDIEFSYLTTAITYNPILEWLGLESGEDIEMPSLNEDNLERAFAWMFVKDQNGRTILGESRNLNKLADVVSNETSIKMLEDGFKLSEAFLCSDGPQTALENALNLAAESAQVAWNMLPKIKLLTGKHLELAETLADQSSSICSYLPAHV